MDDPEFDADHHAGLSLSARSALEAVKTIRYAQFQVDGERRNAVTPGSARARQVLKVIQLTDPRLPISPASEETTM